MAVILGMALQVNAVRSPLQGALVTDADDVMPVERPTKGHDGKKKDMSGKMADKPTSMKKMDDDKEKPKSVKRIEKKDKKQTDVAAKKEAIRSKKIAEHEKSKDKIEHKIDKLGDKKSKAMEKDEEAKDKRVATGKEIQKSHLLNHGHESVEVHYLAQEITNLKELLAREEKALEKLSDGTRHDKREEHLNRSALAKIYENRQRDLRKELSQVEEKIKAVKVAEVDAKNTLQDDKAAYEDLLKKKRRADTVKDSDESASHREMLLSAKETQEMMALHAEQKGIREELAALRIKINENNKKRKEAAKEAGIEYSPRKERHVRETDDMIKDGVHPDENHARHFTQIGRDMKERKEDLGMLDKEDMSMKKDSMRSTKSMKKDKAVMIDETSMPPIRERDRRPTMGEDGVRKHSSKPMKKRDMSMMDSQDDKMAEKKLVRKRRSMSQDNA